MSGGHEERSACNLAKNVTAEDVIGQLLNVWWPLDQTWYTGIVKSYTSSTVRPSVDPCCKARCLHHSLLVQPFIQSNTWIQAL